MFKKMILVAAMALLAISAQVGTASANQVQNGSFETGDFAGWTLTNVLDNDFVMVIGDSTDPSTTAYAGNSEALLGKAERVGTLSQTFSTKIGQAYTVNYWLANDLNGTNSFQVRWNSSVIQATALTGVGAFAYREYQFIATAAGDSSTIAFNFRNDPSIFHLDNVTVAPVPVPGTMLLFGSGLAGLAFFGRRRRMSWSHNQ